MSYPEGLMFSATAAGRNGSGEVCQGAVPEIPCLRAHAGARPDQRVAITGNANARSRSGGTPSDRAMGDQAG